MIFCCFMIMIFGSIIIRMSMSNDSIIWESMGMRMMVIYCYFFFCLRVSNSSFIIIGIIISYIYNFFLFI